MISQPEPVRTANNSLPPPPLRLRSNEKGIFVEHVFVGLLGATVFAAGYFTCHFIKKYRIKAIFFISPTEYQNYPCEERLEKILDTWLNLRSLFYTWRGSLTHSQYFAAVTLMRELDDRLDFENTARNEREESNDY